MVLLVSLLGIICCVVSFGLGLYLGDRFSAGPALKTPKVVLEGSKKISSKQVSLEPVKTATVAKKETSQPVPATEPPPLPFEIEEKTPTGKKGIQLGAFDNEVEAKDFVERNAAALADLEVFVVPTKIAGKGTWYRVRVGSFSDRSAAEIAKQNLPKELAQSAILVSYR